MSSTRARDKTSRPNHNSFQYASQGNSSLENLLMNSIDRQKEDEKNSNGNVNKQSGNSETSMLTENSII